MNYNSVYNASPEDFLSVSKETEGGSTVVLSGPKIKQDSSYHNSTRFEVVRSLFECKNGYDKPVIIDDFYLCYMQYKESDDEEYRLAFEDIVNKETTYLVTRIYSFQWMLKNEQITQQFNLQEPDIIFLNYGKEEAIRKCEELNPDIETEIIQNHIEKTLYENQLEFLGDFIYYESYTPRILTTAIEIDASSGILPSEIQDLISTSFAHSNIAGALMDLQKKIPKSVTSDTKRSINRVLPGSLGVAVVSTGLYHFAIPLIIYWKFIRMKDELKIQEFFGEILSDEMLPHSREKLEEELGLPPRTIETLQEITRPQILADISASVEHNELDTAELIDEVYENREQIEKLERIGKSLSKRVQPLEDHYEESIGTALQDYTEIINDENERMKDALIKELGYTAEYSDTILGQLADLNLREDEIENTRKNLEESSTVLIRGPIGVGKSHFIYELSDRMTENGKTVKYCYPDDIADLKTGLKQLSSRDDELVLVCEYRGDDLNPDRFRRIFGKEIYDLYDTLVVECKESSYHEFRKVWEEIFDTHEEEAANRLKPQEDFNIELDGLDTVKPIPRKLGIINESILESIETISQGNPLIAFEASILALSGKNWETGIGKRGILRKRLDSICTHFENTAPPDVNPTKLLKAAAIIGTMDNLQSIPVIAGSSEIGGAMEFIRTYLNRYIVNEGDHWRLKPDYIRRILFEDTWFKTGGSERLNDHREDYMRRIKENDIGFTGCATNLGEFWQLSNQSEISVSEELVTEAVDELLDESAETSNYSDCLFQFAISGVPLSSSILQRNIYEWSDDWINTTNKDEEGSKILFSITLLAESNIIYRSDLQEFFDLSETGRVFITYIKNSLSALPLDPVLLYYSELISTYIHRRALDVAGDSDRMDDYVQKLEWMINEFGESCTEQTNPEHHLRDIEITDEDIKANLYTLTISGLMARFEPDDMEGHIHYLMNKYKACYTDEEKRSDEQLYSRIIAQLSYKTSADHGEQWFGWLHKAYLHRGGMDTPLNELGEYYKKFKAYCIMNLFRRTVMEGKEIEGEFHIMPDDKDPVGSHPLSYPTTMDQVSSSPINYDNARIQVAKAAAQGKINEFTNKQLFEWWMLLLDQPGCLRDVIEIMFENPELKESTELLFGFIYERIPYLGEKYGVGEEAEEIVSKRFEEIRERYPDVLEDI